MSRHRKPTNLTLDPQTRQTLALVCEFEGLTSYSAAVTYLARQWAKHSQETEMIKVQVDYENNSEDFWQGPGRKVWERWCKEQGIAPDADELVLPHAQAVALMAEAQACPGWSDPGQPEFAPHPLITNPWEDGE